MYLKKVVITSLQAVSFFRQHLNYLTWCYEFEDNEVKEEVLSLINLIALQSTHSPQALALLKELQSAVHAEENPSFRALEAVFTEEQQNMRFNWGSPMVESLLTHSSLTLSDEFFATGRSLHYESVLIHQPPPMTVKEHPWSAFEKLEKHRIEQLKNAQKQVMESEQPSTPQVSQSQSKQLGTNTGTRGTAQLSASQNSLRKVHMSFTRPKRLSKSTPRSSDLILGFLGL